MTTYNDITVTEWRLQNRQLSTVMPQKYLNLLQWQIITVTNSDGIKIANQTIKHFEASKIFKM